MPDDFAQVRGELREQGHVDTPTAKVSEVSAHADRYSVQHRLDIAATGSSVVLPAPFAPRCRRRPAPGAGAAVSALPGRCASQGGSVALFPLQPTPRLQVSAQAEAVLTRVSDPPCHGAFTQLTRNCRAAAPVQIKRGQPALPRSGAATFTAAQVNLRPVRTIAARELTLRAT